MIRREDDADGGSSGGRDEQIVPILERHGIDRALTERLHAVGTELRALTEREGVEFGVTVNMDSDYSLGTTLRGSGNDLDFEPHRRLLRRERRYVTLHTHPGSMPPSHLDFLILIDNPSIRALVVVGRDGTWYVVSLAPSAARPDEHVARATFAAAYVRLRPQYLRRVEVGLMTPREALAAMLDATWRAVARRIGLRYDRVEIVP